MGLRSKPDLPILTDSRNQCSNIHSIGKCHLRHLARLEVGTLRPRNCILEGLFRLNADVIPELEIAIDQVRKYMAWGTARSSSVIDMVNPMKLPERRTKAFPPWLHRPSSTCFALEPYQRMILVLLAPMTEVRQSAVLSSTRNKRCHLHSNFRHGKETRI